MLDIDVLAASGSLALLSVLVKVTLVLYFFSYLIIIFLGQYILQVRNEKISFVTPFLRHE